MPRIATGFVWFMFALALLAALAQGSGAAQSLGPFRVDALTLVLAVAVTFVSGIVHSFARRHMDGDSRIGPFYGRLLGLTLLVLLLLAADHMALFALAWTGMGLLLADLVGHHRGWAQARAAGRLARGWYLGGSAALALGFVLLGGATGTASLHAAIGAVAGADKGLLALACAAFALAGAIQCGLFPFHRWLLSSMTAPTPVSAFMHAGIVNAGGILLARLAPVYEAVPHAMTAVFLLGSLSALFGAAALVQGDVKRGLATSTVAQMGFMVMQCGLGFHAAALAHLVLHGCYKACLFLGAGSALSAARRPGPAEGGLDLRAAALALPAALLGGWVFALVAGKGMGDSGALLVLFAGLAAAQAGLALRGWTAEGWGTLLVATPAVVVLAAAFYGAVVGQFGQWLAAVPGMSLPQPLGPAHGLVALAFAGAWLAVAAGLHRRADTLYARLVALSQPAGPTVTSLRGTYRA